MIYSRLFLATIFASLTSSTSGMPAFKKLGIQLTSIHSTQGSLPVQDVKWLRGIFQNGRQPILQLAELTLRNPRWWVWFPEMMAALQKKAEKNSGKNGSLTESDLRKIIVFFQQYSPRTLNGWMMYRKMVSGSPKNLKLYHKGIRAFFSKATLSQFKDAYPGILKLSPQLEWPLHHFILSGTQKPMSDVRSILEILKPTSGPLRLLTRLLARTPDAKVFTDYQKFEKTGNWDPLLALAMIQCCIRMNQGEDAWAHRLRLPKAYTLQHAKEITQLDIRIMRQLLQEGQGAETKGQYDGAKKLYKKAVSMPIFASIDKAHDAHWTKGFIYFTGLKDYKRALDHFTQSSNAFSARALNQHILQSKRPHPRPSGPGVVRHDVRALFWSGLCCEYLKKPALAKAYYTEAAQYGTYLYGQLACWKLNRPVVLNFANPAPGKKDWHTLAQKEALRIVEIWKKTAPNQVTLPPYDTTLAFCKDLVVLAHTAGDHAAALNLIKLLHPTHLVECAKGMAKHSNCVFRALYPILPTIECQDPALIHSIILAESSFHPTVVSWDGGIGIMQIMPKTAEKAAKDMGIALDKSRLHRDQAYQIRMGTHIITDYLKQMGFRYPSGIAAYNAGVHRAKPWVDNTPALKIPEDALIWIESIPFQITRHYVLTVLESYITYRKLMGSPVQGNEWMDLLRARP
jgi:tetratricopeptide (TPR) repeat protein